MPVRSRLDVTLVTRWSGRRFGAILFVVGLMMFGVPAWLLALLVCGLWVASLAAAARLGERLSPP
jgi:hypothetical protein